MSAPYTRRVALHRLGLWAAASPLLQAQQPPPPRLQGEPPGRITPRTELVNVLEAEAVAQRLLAAPVYASIAGGDRRAFERLIFRPRRFFNVEHLDLTVELLGQKMFTPVMVGPAAHQQKFHAEGELALVRGASAAQATVVISGRSSQPIEKIAAEAKTPLWYQVYPEPDLAPVLARVQQAVQAGCKAVCVTVGAPYEPPGTGGAPLPGKLPANATARMDWAVIDQIRQAAKVPVVLKGIMSPEEARTAVENGVQAIVVSNHGGRFTPGLASPIEVLASVVDAAGGKVPVLIDGAFRRGSDVVKALALGARAVLVARPALWGLSAYGSDGVQTVLRLLQSETGRTMGLNGKTKIAELDRTVVRISKH